MICQPINRSRCLNNFGRAWNVLAIRWLLLVVSTLTTNAMRYIVLRISIFVLCAASAIVANGFLLNSDVASKATVLVNHDSRDVGDSTNSVGREHSSSRQRRSIWTSFIDHMVETFHMMKPSLAKGMIDVEGFSNKLAHQFRDDSKAANVLLSEDEKDKEYDEVDHIFSVSNRKELKSITKDLVAATKVHAAIRKKESSLLKELANYNWNNLDVKDLMFLYAEGACNPKSEKIIEKLVHNKPKAFSKMREGLKQIRAMRQHAIAVFKAVDKRVDDRTLGEEYNYVHSELKYYNDLNQKWLAHQSELLNPTTPKSLDNYD